MAKKSGGPNKSGAIRAYYEANPNAKPMEVSAALAEQGVVVTPAFVSTVRSTDKKKGGKVSRRGRPAGAKAVAPKKTRAKKASKPKTVAAAAPKVSRRIAKPASNEVSLEALLRVKKIVEEMGGVDDARSALVALEKLIG